MCNNTVARERVLKLKRPLASNGLGGVLSKFCPRFREEMWSTYHYSTAQMNPEHLRGLLLAGESTPPNCGAGSVGSGCG